MASTMIPYLTSPKPWKIINGSKYIDGIGNCPFNIIRPTLIIKLPKEYGYYKSFVLHDINIDSLVLLGFNDMRRFLEIKSCYNNLIRLETKNEISKYNFSKYYYILLSFLIFWLFY